VNYPVFREGILSRRFANTYNHCQSHSWDHWNAIAWSLEVAAHLTRAW
jgi:hypothetical protein